VDVPGHERFVPNMLAGVGSVPAALLVVAADEGWMPQSAEHLAALDALGVRHGLVVITRTDLADPSPATAQALAEIAPTSLGRPDFVAVSAINGAGMDALRRSLDRLIAKLPTPDGSAPVRLWVDRSFSIRGSGTVVTGTLTAGSLRTGQELQLARTGERLHVRGLQSLGEAAATVEPVARVAVNLRGVERDHVRRGDALLTPGGFQITDTVDIRLRGDAVASLPSSLTLHIGAAAVVARIRPLGGDAARLSLVHPLPLHIGDRALLRDPGRRHVAGGVVMLDVSPPPLRRRGAAAARAAVLAQMDGRADDRGELARRHLVRRGELERMGVKPTVTPITGDWLADPDYWDGLRGRLADEVARHARERPLDAAVPIEALRRSLNLPARELVEALVAPPFAVRRGRVGLSGPVPALPKTIADAVDRLRDELVERPYHAPSSVRLAELGLGPREIAAAVRAGALQRLSGDVILLPGAVDDAVGILAALPQPFTPSQAREELGTSRRVALPLLELLDRLGATRRLPDGNRVVLRRPS
jgi:selenocysteine-specific elongation factor